MRLAEMRELDAAWKAMQMIVAPGLSLVQALTTREYDVGAFH